jgi:two-component system, OmpR family, response regulator
LERFFILNKSGKKSSNAQSNIMTSTAVQTKTAQKILIIEDEGEMCLVLNILLNNEEFELQHVQNLSDAAEYLAKEQPSLTILDNKLPDGYGIDFINFIKKKNPSIKIIMITGFDASAKDVALENGADFFLEKPFTKYQLFDAIKALLK